MAISLNYTSFTSPTMAVKVLAAMLHCRRTGDAVRLNNRKGQPFLLVTIHKDALGYSFKFLDTDGRDVARMIIKAAVSTWEEHSCTTFWSMVSDCFDLTEHPLITAARKALAEVAQAQSIADLKDQGVTHTATTYGGAEINVAFQRDWLCRKRMYVLCEDGVFRKVTREAFLMISKVEPL